MSSCTVVFTLLCSAVLSGSSARRSSPDQEDVQGKIDSARCTSRCLTLHMTQLTAAFKHIQSDGVLGWCENHRRCSQCLQPCKDYWQTKKLLPPKSCEKQTECVTSREFLESLRSSRQGDCPSAQKATGFAAACVESCSVDRHCPAPRKCCSNGCGHTCQSPANLYKGVPLKPRREMSFLEDGQGHARVAWVSKFNVSVEPVVYVLQSRWNTGIHPSEDHASPWSTVAMSLSERVVVPEVRSQRWYQFRVAAINSQGSRGFTTPSKHYISSRDPSPPEAPINIRVTNQTLFLAPPGLGPHLRARSGGQAPAVGVLVRWEPPREGDLPVHHYRVTWTPPRHKPALQGLAAPASHARGPAAHRHKAHTGKQDQKESTSRVTPGAQCELWLQGLSPATSYSLFVQTVNYWGQKRLKSPRSQVTFTTISGTESPSPDSAKDFSNELPFSSSSSFHPPSSSSSSADPPVSSSPRPGPAVAPGDLRLEAASPHFHNSQLQVKVFWKWLHPGRHRHSGPYVLRWSPHACGTNVTSTEKTASVQGTHHTITGLLFSCKYQVTVTTEEVLGSEAVAWVTTPVCSSLKVRGGQTSPCGADERPLASRKVVLRPERLNADFQQLNRTLLATFRWRLSQNAVDHAAIKGFQFTWKQLTPPSGVYMATGLEETLISQSQTVAPSQRSVTVNNLQANTFYQLQLQIMTAEGVNSASISKTIHTPAINETLL
ncbi:LOW QUALITY PROTEIN: anosmin-1-like [Gadus macrocephalus]|uniref:LOW QUALITY PROTEIN: anosmin-1-like n=1 Tax=Gadus macrocephalus TaxID=80720 RepID=UPI0028CB3210|nr:LOW QUALITY PROTEIN: anosmin-1-like [Gadus macrocephalus]